MGRVGEEEAKDAVIAGTRGPPRALSLPIRHVDRHVALSYTHSSFIASGITKNATDSAGTRATFEPSTCRITQVCLPLLHVHAGA